MRLLELNHVSARYGDFQALFDLSLSVDVGETLAIIGANGSGKSTLLRTIAGTVDVSEGSIVFDGQDLGTMPAHERVRHGVSLVPEGRLLFPSLDVRENLLIGAYSRRTGPWSLDAVLAAFPLLTRLLTRPASVLSGGEQQTVAIARSLMSNPKLMLLDEVSLGLAPIVVKQVYEALPIITSSGTTVLVVEQDITQALSVADRVMCLLEGRVALEGRAIDLSRNEITKAYFGLDEEQVR